MDKLVTVLEALQQGQEIKLDNMTYVWLDKPFVTQIRQDGTMWGVQGLAIKGKSYNSGQDPMDQNSGEDTYLGRSDIPFGYFYRLCDSLSDEEILAIKANIVLNSINKKERA